MDCMDRKDELEVRWRKRGGSFPEASRERDFEGSPPDTWRTRGGVGCFEMGKVDSDSADLTGGKGKVGDDPGSGSRRSPLCVDRTLGSPAGPLGFPSMGNGLAFSSVNDRAASDLADC